MITMPATPTNDGTLQLVQFGTGPANGPYYSCANIRIVVPGTNPPPPPGSPPPPSPAGSAPALTMASGLGMTMGTARSKGVKTPISCSEQCQIGAVLYVSKAMAKSLGLVAKKARLAVGSARMSLATGAKGTLSVKLTRAFKLKLGSATKRVVATLETTATDEAGLHSTKKTRVTFHP
jgi:hypothetical protein